MKRKRPARSSVKSAPGKSRSARPSTARAWARFTEMPWRSGLRGSETPAPRTANSTFGPLTAAPANKHTRLIVNIVDDGLAVDTSYSEWFDT